MLCSFTNLYPYETFSRLTLFIRFTDSRYIAPQMKRLSSLVLLLIAFSLLAQTAVSSFSRGFVKYTVSASSAEESAEEDESEETMDKDVHAIVPGLAIADLPTPTTCFETFNLLEVSREIIAPPPQA